MNNKYYHNILTHYNAIHKLIHGVMCSPRFCTFQTSYACNHKCKGCSYNNILNGKMMKEKDHIKIIYDLINIGVKGFEFCGGGEPFTLPYIDKLIDILIKHDCGFGSITNGSLLTDDLIERFVRYGTYIRISLEASNPMDFKKYKQVSNNQWPKIIVNIDKLVKLKKKYNSDLDIGIKFAVSKTLRGKQHYIDSLNLAKNLSVTNIQFKSLRHEPEELTLFEKVEEGKILNKISSSIPIISNIVPQNDIPQCWLNPLHTVVDWCGNVYICCYYYYREKEFKIGNMLEVPFEKFWYDSEHQNKIKSIDKRKCSNIDCKFFNHHKTIKDAFKNNRNEFL